MIDSPSNHRFERLLAVCRSIASFTQLGDLLQSLVQSAAELLDSENGSILLYDAELHCLRFAAGPETQLDTLKNLGVPVERSVAGWVFTHARPVKLNQASGDERIFRVVDREVSEETDSLLAAPMICQGKTIGVLEAMNKRDPAGYNEEDLMILETLAAQAAFAIAAQRKIDAATRDQQRSVELNQVKSDLIVFLSQEARAALTTIFLESTELSKDAVESHQPRIESILSAAGRLKEVAGQMETLDALSQGKAGMKIERIEAAPFVRRVVEVFFAEAAARNITIVEDVPEGLAFDGDAAWVAVALRNLVENALTFTYHGGWVRVHLEALPEFIKFAVIDQGVGIPEEEQNRIFERFYQVRPQPVKHAGVGLGLSIARNVVELHGGEIWVESAEGLGSTFAFILPNQSED